MLRTEIDKDEPLFPGDVIEMQFKTWGPDWIYLRAAELAVLKWRMEKKNPDYEMTAWDSTTYPNRLIMTFKILESRESTPEIQQAGIGTAAVIAVIVIGGGRFAWLSLDKIYKISRTPAGQVALVGASSFSLVFVGVVGYLLLAWYFRWGNR